MTVKVNTLCGYKHAIGEMECSRCHKSNCHTLIKCRLKEYDKVCWHCAKVLAMETRDAFGSYWTQMLLDSMSDKRKAHVIKKFNYKNGKIRGEK